MHSKGSWVFIKKKEADERGMWGRGHEKRQEYVFQANKRRQMKGERRKGHGKGTEMYSKATTRRPKWTQRQARGCEVSPGRRAGEGAMTEGKSVCRVAGYGKKRRPTQEGAKESGRKQARRRAMRERAMAMRRECMPGMG